jgi:hypothetical protein
VHGILQVFPSQQVILSVFEDQAEKSTSGYAFAFNRIFHPAMQYQDFFFVCV